ncbi:unnamed protein product [Spirodela intermedia]|uniref:Uncharacterized protein n=2 Tax=Spirodela intermedia TaxID=51605 RepID=A0A7I8I7N0_SPIIN|nr:unnamed protein product [Spirodela intermedia]CAA6653448.1 unnamed protein product [Spirodela intermedia]CAA7387673.1 unnamed protein product [Spirodela intermedia]
MRGDPEIPGKIYPDVLSEARKACYTARDAFYACLEKETGRKNTESGYSGLLYPAECAQSRADYVKQCRPAWVKHFDKLAATNKKVKRLLDDDDPRRGPISLPQPFVFKP